MKKFASLLCLFLALALFFVSAFADTGAPSVNWYEVFVYSFADSDGDGIGDLKGLIGKLDYIRDLGFDGIWLMPIMPSPSYHKYDVTDYMNIDPVYGSLDDMDALVKAAHEKGIRLIIDLPVNHTSTQHPWFLSAVNALKKGEDNNPYIDYYNFTKTPDSKTVPVEGTDWHYEEQFSGGNMPDLNLDSQAVRKEIREILRFWLIDLDVDGFRLDAVTSFYAGNDPQSIEFLRFLKDSAEQIKPGSFLVGECWKGLHQIADYYQSGIDSFFLFPASQAEGYIASSMRARKPAEAYVKNYQKVKDALPDVLWTPFLSNHDTGRTVGLVQGRQAPERVKFAHALLGLMEGFTFTYYGEEIGMAGAGEDPNKRLAMDWGDVPRTTQPPGVTREEYPFPPVSEQIKDPLSIFNYVKALNHLRLTYPGIALGETAFEQVNTDSLLMRKSLFDAELYLAVNFSAKETRDITLPAAMTLKEGLYTGEDKAVLNGETLSLPPYGIAVMLPKR